jgi:glycosidase
MNKTHPWWQTGTIYQIYPRSFKDSNGDGIGDLAGVIEKLDYLSETLGVDAIWLSPFYPSPMADFGYDVSDYTGVDPIFGDLDTFNELVRRAHQRGLKAIIDFVPNHTSEQHPWFQESRASRDNPKRDWYIWADAKPGGALPNNWLSVFGGPAWEWDAATGQFYLHSFLKEQPDLNWRNPEVKAAMFEVVRTWLEREVDGLRIDVAHFIMKDPLLRDNPLKPQASLTMHKSLGEFDTQIHLNDHGHPDVHQVYRELRQLLESYSRERPRFAVGEIHLFDWQTWATYYGKELDELHMPFNFQLLGIPWNASAVRNVVDALEAALPPGAWPNYVLGNHDETRLASRVGASGARLAAMLLLTLRGTPTIYNGDEIGMTNVPIPAGAMQDPWGVRMPGLGRDPYRTPMQWTPGSHAGFAPPGTSSLWLPLDEGYRSVNVERQLAESDSILNLHRRLLVLRKDLPALQVGDYQPLEGIPQDCYAYLRQVSGSPALLVLLNFGHLELQVNLPALRRGEILLSTHLDRQGRVDLSNCSLRAGEGLLIEVVP